MCVCASRFVSFFFFCLVPLADSFHRGSSEARGGHIDEKESEAKKNND